MNKRGFRLKNRYIRFTAIVLLAAILLSNNLAYAKEINTTIKTNTKNRSGTPKITSMTMFSDNEDPTRAFQGDTVSIMFFLEDELALPSTSFEVVFDGQVADTFSFGTGTYFSEVIIDDIDPTIGYGQLSIFYIIDDGSKILLADESMGGKGIFLSDKSTLIDVLTEDIDIRTSIETDISDADLASICNTFDNNSDTYCELDPSGDGKYVSIIFDFKRKSAVNLSRVEFLARQDQYYTRANGAYVQVSNDGTKWTKLTGNASATKKWQILNMTKDTSYRYVRISCLSSWYGNLSEIRLYRRNAADHTQDIPEVIESSLRCNKKNSAKVLPGDKITLQFKTDIPLRNMNYTTSVFMLGSYYNLTEIGEKTYEASAIIPEKLILDRLYFNIRYMPLSGQSISLCNETTDNSYLFVTNEENSLSLLNGDIDFIDFRGKNTSQTIDQILHLTDDDERTSSNFQSGDDEDSAFVTFDFKEDGISLSRIELLPRQVRSIASTGNIQILASNDNENWTNIQIEDAKEQQTWQSIYLTGGSKYRYIKIINKNQKELDLAELKLFESEDETAYHTRYINLNTQGINNPYSYSRAFQAWDGSKVYFGNSDKDSLLWRVLNKEEDGNLLLFADNVIKSNVSYHHKFMNTTWATSTIRSYLNGYVYRDQPDDPGVVIDYTKNNFIDSYFTADEKNAILTSHLTTNESSSGSSGGPDTDDKLFLLSIEDAVNKNYGFVNDNCLANPDGDPTETWWWLRTVGSSSKAYAATVSSKGEVDPIGANVGYLYKNERGLRPAYRIDADSILFTTFSDIKKSEYAAFGSKESKVESEAYLDGSWNVTLKTTKDSLDAVSLGSTELVRSEHMNITIKHAPASILDKDAQVSAMLLDEKQNVLYYGKVNEDADATSSKLMLPSALKAGDYTLKIFAEVLNEGNTADYATDFSTIPISIASGVEVEDILGLPKCSTAYESIVLDGYVVPQIASFNQISYYLQDVGDTAATLSENIITYENPGVISVVAVVNNGLLYGKPYTKQFTININPNEELIPLPTEPEDIPSTTPLPDSSPTVDITPDNTPTIELQPDFIPFENDQSDDIPMNDFLVETETSTPSELKLPLNNLVAGNDLPFSNNIEFSPDEPSVKPDEDSIVETQSEEKDTIEGDNSSPTKRIKKKLLFVLLFLISFGTTGFIVLGFIRKKIKSLL